MDLHLVGAATCPFTERVLVALLEKQASFALTIVDPLARPEWFLSMSPRGRVPLLVADGVALFEWHAICEFVDEVLDGPRLLSEQPADRARDRAWVRFADEALLHPVLAMLLSGQESEVAAACDAVEESLGRLQDELAGQDWLTGDGQHFGMVDLALAPVFRRLAYLESLGTYVFPADQLPGVATWREQISARPSVSGARIEGFEEGMQDLMRRAGALLLPEQ